MPSAYFCKRSNISITGIKRTSADADGLVFSKVTSDSKLPHPGNSFCDFSDLSVDKNRRAADEKDEDALIKEAQARARAHLEKFKARKRKKLTPRRQFQERYRELVFRDFMHEAPPFSAANEGAFEQSVSRRGEENLIKVLS